MIAFAMMSRRFHNVGDIIVINRGDRVRVDMVHRCRNKMWRLFVHYV